MSRIILTDAPRQFWITVQTRLGSDIPNGFTPDVKRWAGIDAQYAAFRKQWPKCLIRPHFLPFYNCHGMTFASRRTCIDEPASVRRILEEDGYEKIESTAVHEGDIVLYLGANGDTEHSGIIVSSPPDGQGINAKVLSKWGASGPEVVHLAYECPYDSTYLQFYRVTKDVA